MKTIGFFALAALLAAQQASALQVKYVEGTPSEYIAELDAHGMREETEGWAAEICRSYTDGSTAAVDGQVLYFRPYAGGGVAGTTGGIGSQVMISLSMDWYHEVSPNEARGALIHELGHAVQSFLSKYLNKEIQLDQTIELDNGTTESLTEGLAEWVRRYCFASAKEVQEREYDIAKSDYAFDGYGDGAGLIAYIRRAYGSQILKDLLYYCSTNRGYKVDTMWPALTGRTFDDILLDWATESRICDPVVQWTYDGTASGLQRCNSGKCSFNFNSRTGTLKGGIEDGNWTVALRGKVDPQSTDSAVFSLGSSFEIQASQAEAFHTMVAVKDGSTVRVYLGGAVNMIRQLSAGTDLSSSVTIGAGFECQDFRMFNRALSATELQQYFTAFSADYNPTAAATARWVGPGNGALSSAANWECVNSNGDPVSAVPSAGTAVVAWGATVPNVPSGTALPCSSFTVKRWITLDRDTDWRGLSVPVTLDADVLHLFARKVRRQDAQLYADDFLIAHGVVI